MGGKRSRDKGARFEREAAALFRALTGLDGIRRGRQDNKNRFVGSSHESDVAGVPGLWIEAKHVQVTAPGSWWKQACRDADGTGLEPIVIFRRDRGPTLVMMSKAMWLEWVDGRDAFSLTCLQSVKVSWDKLPELGELRCLAVPLSPPVAIGRWEVFKELWTSCRGS